MLTLAAPALVVVAGVGLLPMAWLTILSVLGDHGPTLEHYRRLVENPSYLRILAETFRLSLTVTLLAAFVGYPLAYMISQLSGGLARLCFALVLMPFWTSVLVRNYAWMVLLQRRGVVNDALLAAGLTAQPIQLVNNLTGTVIGMLHVTLPFLILPTLASLRAVDRDSLRAAAGLGAAPMVVFWTVCFPQSLPGLMAGSLLVFVVSLGFYVTPALLGGGHVTTVAMAIQQTAMTHAGWGAAGALGVVLLGSTLAAFLLASRLVPLDRLFGGN